MDWIGAFWIIGVVAEIVIMFSYQRIWGKIKEEWVFIISAILNSIGVVGLQLIVHLSKPWFFYKLFTLSVSEPTRWQLCE